MIRTTTLSLLALLVATAVLAERGMSRNGLAVAGDRDGFEVFARAGLGGADYFCAAGDFARTYLNAGATDRVEILSPLGPSRSRPGQRSVVFELRPPRSAANTGFDQLLLRPRSVGVSRTVAHATQVCGLSSTDGRG